MNDVPDRQDALDAFAREFLMPETEPNGNGKHANTPDLSDDEIIELFRKADNAAKFATLFDEGDTSGHDNDNSSADLALVGMLAFYTDDPQQLERLMDASALGQRSKWRKRADYRRRTINKVLSDPHRERYRYRYPYKGSNAVTPDEEPHEESQKPSVEVLSSVDFAEMKEPGPREWVLEPLVASGWPTIVFGGAGVAKTIMALSLGQAIVDPETEKWIAWPVATCPVVYLDLELNAEEQARRAYRIARGNERSVPPKGLRYMTTFGVPRRKRGNVMKRALEECNNHKAGVLLAGV